MTTSTNIGAQEVAAEGRPSGRRRFRRLLRVLADKGNILITTHCQPDPDALASAHALAELLRGRLPEANIYMSVKGQIAGGINEPFSRLAGLKLTSWTKELLEGSDAIVLLDTQPSFDLSPLPEGVAPTAIIDHHRSRRGRRPACPFVDIRPEVGAAASIVFSYFLEADRKISPDLAATLLYAIESDLAGAAGAPTDLDNLALSSLTLVANTRKLYQMRYVDLPQSYYLCYASGLVNAVYWDGAILSHLDEIDSQEKPAVIADFLLRFEQVQWALVTAVYGSRMLLSLRCGDPRASAADIVRRLTRKIGEGGGHRSKAGGFIPLENGSPTEIERTRVLLRRRFLRALKIKPIPGKRLVPKPEP